MLKRIAGLVVGAMVLGASSVFAAPIPLTPPSASNSQISYTNGETDLGLYGPASLVGTTILFPSPSSFLATASNNSATTTSDRLSMTISSTNGQDLQKITIHEVGDWAILNIGSVKMSGGLFLTSLSPGTFGNVYTASPVTVYTDVENALTINSPSRPTADGSGLFTTDYVINLPAGIKSVQLALNNTLQAAAGSNSTSVLWKKGLSLNATLAVPEPACLALIALGGTVVLRRRRMA